MKKVPLREKIGYGVGAIGLDLSYGLFYSFLSLYLTNALKISPLFLLILAPIARIWDGVNDPMMGSIVDKTNTKMGKYRPWILTGAVFNAIVLSLLFNIAGFNAGTIGVYVMVAVFYVLWGMTNTLADIPFWSMIPTFATEEKDRNLVSTIARTFSGLGQGIVSIFTSIVVVKFAGELGKNLDELGAEALSKGFGIWSIIAAVALVVFAAISVASTKETVYGEKGEKFSFRKALGVIRHNDQLLIFMLFAMISNCGYYMTSGISSYYFLQVRGDLTLQSKFNLLGSVGSVLSILVIPICDKFMTNRATYRFSLTAATAGYIGMAVVGYLFGGNVLALGICYLIASIGIGSMFVNQTVMLADIVDYGEYKLGTRNQSLTFSMKGFLQKMAYTLQSIIMYSAFVITKYDFSGGASQAVENSSANSAISFMMFIVPPVMLIISHIIFASKYKIYGGFKREILDAVTAKREALANPDNA
ncbi:MAG: MFS transporter [Clostridia bacterium]|nr:MFS transporter [Clostridia bacterium]